LKADAAVEKFMKEAPVAPAWKIVAHSFLRFGMNHYDANAFLNMYPLHLLSTEQLHQMLSMTDAPSTFKNVLDVGAGDGSMAESLLKPKSETIHTTETATRMIPKIESRGLKCFQIDLAKEDFAASMHNEYDLMMLLNVIDRTDKPISLLKRMVGRLSRDGYFVIASPLPLRPICYDGATARHPSENFEFPKNIIKNEFKDEWEDGASWFISNILPSFGLKPICFSRVPYVSGGDVSTKLYTHDDIVVICSKKD